ncbi:aldo/keto reductase [Nocardia gamkensis]|nr:aldo/keto reductase [Nocardia gamkensis]
MANGSVPRRATCRITPRCSAVSSISRIPPSPRPGPATAVHGRLRSTRQPRSRAVLADHGQVRVREKTTDAGSLTIAEIVRQVARQLGRSPAQVALSWLLRRPGVTAPVLGARTRAHSRTTSAPWTSPSTTTISGASAVHPPSRRDIRTTYRPLPLRRRTRRLARRRRPAGAENQTRRQRFPDRHRHTAGLIDTGWAHTRFGGLC